MKKILLIILSFTICFCAAAQENSSAKKTKKDAKKKHLDALIKQEEEGVIVYKKQTAFGIKLNTDGYGIFFEMGRAQSVKKSLLYQIEIGERKHQKEEKQSIPNLSTSPLIYGKLNFFYPVKLGVQQQILLGNKSNKNGVSVTGNLGGGLLMGLLRPYEVEVDKGGQRTFVRYDSPDSLLFINGPYYGGPNLGTGWNHLKVTPGVYVKPALRFDYGRLNETVTAIEVGLNAEFYTKKIPQMLYNKQKQFFFSAYFSIIFGKRK